MENDILVSISCITYNHEKYIRQTIESFLNQKTDFKYEILIHDDASTDGTQEIIEEYQKKYPNIIKPILRTENQYSQGIKRISYLNNDLRAKGKYIAMCEGDDYWNDDMKLQKQVQYLENDENISMVFTSANILDSSTEKVVRVDRAYNSNCFSEIKDIIIKGGAFCPTASIIYRKSDVLEMPEFFMKAHVGDYPLQLILASKGKVYYIDEPMVTYRINRKGSWSSTQDYDSKIKTMERDIDLLNNFNNYTNNKYNEYVVHKIKECRFWTDFIKANIKKVKSEEFKEFYENVGLGGKVKMYFRGYFPKIYRKINSRG